MSKHARRMTDAVASEKRAQFTAPPTRRGPSWNAVLVALAVVLAGLIAASRGGVDATRAVQLASAGADAVFAAAQFADGQARFYRHVTSTGREIRFFVIQSADGVLRAAFDACDTCFREKRGYRQEGDVMVCNNCGQKFRSNDINVLRGGCNPAPVEVTASAGEVRITAAALEQGSTYF